MKIYYKNDIFLQICKGDRGGGVQKTSSSSYLFFLSIFFFFNTIPETPLGLRPRFARNEKCMTCIHVRKKTQSQKYCNVLLESLKSLENTSFLLIVIFQGLQQKKNGSKLVRRQTILGTTI